MEEEIETNEEVLDDVTDDTFNESFTDKDDDDSVDYDEDESEEDEFFKQNPLKAIWLKLLDIEDMLQDDSD